MSVAANRSQFDLKVSGCQEELRVVYFNVNEVLSDCYEINVEVACENPSLDFSTLHKQAGRLTANIQDHVRYFQGEVSQIKQLDIGRRFSRYFIQLVPKLWFLQLRHTSRTFQQLTVPQIIEQLLIEANITAEHVSFRLTNDYQPLVYSVQHQESEYDFIARLMAEAGLHFHFEHQADKHVLVIGDGQPAFPPVTGNTLNFQVRSGMTPDHDTLYDLRYKSNTVVGKVALRDFNFEHPGLDQNVQQAADKHQAFERYHFPGQYLKPNEGEQQAKRQLQADQAKQKTLQGGSNSARLSAGHRVTIQKHPSQRLNQAILLTLVSHQGSQPQALEEEGGGQGKGSQYNNTFEAIPAETPFKQDSQYTKHHLKGLQTAVVTGPNGEEIFTNAHGQVKIQTQWDRQAQQNEKSSKWVRVAQTWTGPQWGHFVLPRVGQEVMLDFINGDPDQPIIIGRLYHGIHRTPYKLPLHKTRSTLKSLSTPGGEGFNEIRLEDKKGSEQLFIHGEKDKEWRIKNMHRTQVKANRHLMTYAARFEMVKNEQHQLTDQTFSRQIGKSQHITIGQSYQLITGNAHLEKTGNEQHLKSGLKIVIEAGQQATIKAGGSFITLDASGISVVGPVVRLNSGGSPGKGSAVNPQPPIKAMEADRDKPGSHNEDTPAQARSSVMPIPFQPGFCEECEQAAEESE